MVRWAGCEFTCLGRFLTMTIATFAIAGFPPLAGFFSKDDSVDGLFQPSRELGDWLIGLITAFITSFYMFRLWFMTFFGDYRGAARMIITTRGRGRPRHTDTGMATAIRMRVLGYAWGRSLSLPYCLSSAGGWHSSQF